MVSNDRSYMTFSYPAAVTPRFNNKLQQQESHLKPLQPEDLSQESSLHASESTQNLLNQISQLNSPKSAMLPFSAKTPIK